MSQPTQMELLGNDLDLDSFKLQIKKRLPTDLVDAVISASCNRTIEGASTITVVVDDSDYEILRSGYLTKRFDVRVDELDWTFIGFKKLEHQLTLTFEDKVVNVLRQFKSFIKADRDDMTRAQFVQRMLREAAKIYKFDWVIPELELKQTIGAQLEEGQILVDQYGEPTNQIYPDPTSQNVNRAAGIPLAVDLKVKRSQATAEQINNANIALYTAVQMGARTKVLVSLVAAMIVESRIINVIGGDANSTGILQQQPDQGWPATRNIPTDVAEFVRRAMSIDKLQPNLTIGELAQSVQHSAYPERYDQYADEAEAFVVAYGSFANTTALTNAIGIQPYGFAGGDYWFTRGRIEQNKQNQTVLTPESSWECMQRLAKEVAWRAFCVSNTVYFLSEPYLFKSKPFMVIDEQTEGIDWIDGDFDEGKRNAVFNITAHLERWSGPPGSIIQIKNMGPMNGKYVVNDVDRDFHHTVGTIKIKRPLPVLPEPVATQTQQAFATTAPPQVIAGSVQDQAKQLLTFMDTGAYRDDNGRAKSQLEKIVAGQKLRNQGGQLVDLDVGVTSALLLLLNSGFRIGTFSFAEDHSFNDGQHPKGQAVDISSIGRNGELWTCRDPAATEACKDAMLLLQDSAWDLICNGCGQYDSSVQALQVDNREVRGGVWATDHINHIHYGTAPGARH